MDPSIRPQHYLSGNHPLFHRWGAYFHLEWVCCGSGSDFSLAGFDLFLPQGGFT